MTKYGFNIGYIWCGIGYSGDFPKYIGHIDKNETFIIPWARSANILFVREPVLCVKGREKIPDEILFTISHNSVAPSSGLK